jgi:hypothetical protein
MIGSTAVADETRDVDLAVVDPPLQRVVGAEPRETIIAIVEPPLHLVLCQGLLLGFLRRLCVDCLNGRLGPASREQDSILCGIKTYCLGWWLVGDVVGGVRVCHCRLRKTCLA